MWVCPHPQILCLAVSASSDCRSASHLCLNFEKVFKAQDCTAVDGKA